MDTTLSEIDLKASKKMEKSIQKASKKLAEEFVHLTEHYKLAILLADILSEPKSLENAK